MHGNTGAEGPAEAELPDTRLREEGQALIRMLWFPNEDASEEVSPLSLIAQLLTTSISSRGALHAAPPFTPPPFVFFKAGDPNRSGSPPSPAFHYRQLESRCSAVPQVPAWRRWRRAGPTSARRDEARVTTLSSRLQQFLLPTSSEAECQR